MRELFLTRALHYLFFYFTFFFPSLVFSVIKIDEASDRAAGEEALTKSALTERLTVLFPEDAAAD